MCLAGVVPLVVFIAVRIDTAQARDIDEQHCRRRRHPRQIYRRLIVFLQIDIAFLQLVICERMVILKFLSCCTFSLPSTVVVYGLLMWECDHLFNNYPFSGSVMLKGIHACRSTTTRSLQHVAQYDAHTLQASGAHFFENTQFYIMR